MPLMIDIRFAADYGAVDFRGEADLLHTAGELAKLQSGGIDQLFNLFIYIVEKLARNGQAQSGDLFFNRGRVVNGRKLLAVEIAWIIVSDRLQYQRSIRHRARHRTGVVERRGKRNDAARAYEAVGGLQAGDSAVRRRQADGSGGVGGS